MKTPSRHGNASGLMPPTPIASLFFAACLFSILAASGISPAQDEPVPEPLPADAPRILGTVADGTPPPATPRPEAPDSRILDTTVRRQGGRAITIHKVEPPDIPEPPPPPPPPDLSDPRVQAWLAKAREEHRETRLAIVSATVYDHEKSLVRWWIPGSPPRSFEAWSNIDFNHLSGFGSFEAGGIHYGLLLGIGNMNTVKWREFLASRGRVFKAPESPELPADRSAFVLTRGDAVDKEGMALIEGLHELYRNEKDRLAAAYEGRERARKEREARLEANPPKPQDVTLRFWTGKGRSPQAESSNQGGETR